MDELSIQDFQGTTVIMSTHFRKCLSTVPVIFLLITSSISAFAQVYDKQLADGVNLTQTVTQQSAQGISNQPQVVNVIKIDPYKAGVRLQAVISGSQVMAGDATKGRETISSIAKRLNAVAAINGDFFPFTGDMLSMHITGGELVSEPYSGRMVFGITSDGRCLFDTLGFDAKLKLQDGRWISIKGINRPRGKNEIVAYTGRFAANTCTAKPCTETIIKLDAPLRVNTPVSGTVIDIKDDTYATVIPQNSIVLSGEGVSSIPLSKWLKVNDTVTLEFAVRPAKTTGWENVVEAVGGGPCLIKNGQVSTDAAEEGFDASFSAGLHPRTAIGITGDGKIILAAIDGRQSTSKGMSIKQLADFMKSQECIEAMNLDGGGSTTMTTSFGVLNSPSDGTERPVANGIAVFANVTDAPYPPITITSLTDPVQSGTSVQFILSDASTGQPLDSTLLAKTIWSTSGGIGFVDQSGRFYGIKARKGKVIAKLGSNMVSSPVEVTAGAADKFLAKIKPDDSDAPNRSTVEISVSDLNGNPVKDQKITLKANGGIPDLNEAYTESSGKTSIGITWDGAQGDPASVTVTCGNFEPKEFKRPK